MKLKKLIDAISEELHSAAFEYSGDHAYISVQHKTLGGSVIDVTYYMEGADRDKCEVLVYGEGIAQDFANLEEYLCDQLSYSLDWDAVEDAWREDSMDIYQRNGFDSEADFWRWKEGWR